MDLDAFVNQAVELKKTKKPRARKARAVQPDGEFAKTKEMLRELALERAEPVEVVLLVTDQECECGNRMHSVNNTPLVKCEGSNFTHFRQITSFKDMNQYDDLPRIIQRHTVLVPYCEDCFVNANVRNMPMENSIWEDLMQETRSDG